MTPGLDYALDYEHAWRGLASDPRFLSGHMGNSSLSGRAVDLYSLGSSRTTVEVDRSRALNPVQAKDVTAQRAACDTAGGALDQGNGWWLIREADGCYHKRRGAVRDPAINHAARQAEHEAAWLSSGPHRCGECGIEMSAGHYGREKRYCLGHGGTRRKAVRRTADDAKALEDTSAGSQGGGR
jgi:hypothetical protein